MIQLDYSAINQYCQCPAKYAFEHIAAIPSPISDALYIGSCVHLACAYFYEARQLSGIVFTEQEFLEIAAQCFDSGEPAKARDGSYRDVLWTNKAASKQQVLDLIKCYYPYARAIEPMLVEHQVERNLNGVLVFGTIDLVTSDGIPIDIKTAGRAPYQTDLASNLQPTVYCWLLGGPSKFVYHYLLKNKTPAFQQYITDRSQDDLTWFEQSVELYAKAIESGVFFPHRSSMCKYCGYEKLCSREGGLKLL